MLVVSYHFPPSNAVGAKRWGEFARIAIERGWHVDVIAHGADHTVDDGENMTVTRVPSREPRRAMFERALTGIGRTLRSVTLPRQSEETVSTTAAAPTSLDRHEIESERLSLRALTRSYNARSLYAVERVWSAEAQAIALDLASRNEYSAVITSGPPHRSHEVGKVVNERFGTPFVMDMRDLWADAEMLHESFASPTWFHIAERLEMQCVERASLVVANTPLAKERLDRRYPGRENDIVAVTNGTDGGPLSVAPRDSRFVISHIGTIYLDRDPLPLLRAAATVISDHSLRPDQFSFVLMGEIEELVAAQVEAEARRLGVTAYVEIQGPQSYANAVALTERSSVHVILSGAHQSAIPAKLFESARYPAWILALSAAGSATARILEGTSAAVARPDDTASIAGYLDQWFRDFNEGHRPEPLAVEARFRREFQAEIFFDALERRLRALA